MSPSVWTMQALLGFILCLAWTLPVASAPAKDRFKVFQITGDQVYEDRDLAFEVAVGHVKAFVDKQDADLEADQIVYDGYANILQADGHVRIMRCGGLTTGARFAFKLDSDEYLVTDADVLIPHEHNLVSRQILTDVIRDQLRLNALATIRARNKRPRFSQLEYQNGTFMQKPDSPLICSFGLMRNELPPPIYWEFHDPPTVGPKERNSDFGFPVQWHYGIFQPDNVFNDLDPAILNRFLHGNRDSYRGFEPL